MPRRLVTLSIRSRSQIEDGVTTAARGASTTVVCRAESSSRALECGPEWTTCPRTAIRGLPSIHLRPHWQDKCSITLSVERSGNIATASSPYVSDTGGSEGASAISSTRILPYFPLSPTLCSVYITNSITQSWTERCLVQLSRTMDYVTYRYHLYTRDLVK